MLSKGDFSETSRQVKVCVIVVFIMVHICITETKCIYDIKKIVSCVLSYQLYVSLFPPYASCVHVFVYLCGRE